MRQRLIVVLAGGLLLAMVSAKAAATETADEKTAKEIVNVNNDQDRIRGAMLVAKKPRLRFKSKSRVPKTCGASGLGEKEIRDAEQKRLMERLIKRQSVNSSNDILDNGTNGTTGGGDEQSD